jgi:hypothetical protein
MRSFADNLFKALKEAGVKGLGSRRSARAIAGLVGQELTFSEITDSMTDEQQVPLAKSHDWMFMEEDDEPIIPLGNGKYEVRLYFRQFAENVKPGEMVTAMFTLGLTRTRKRRSCKEVYKIEWFKVEYTTYELHYKLYQETVKWLPDYFVADLTGVRAIKQLLSY